MMKDPENIPAPDRMLTVPEAAARLGLSVATIRAWISRRRLAHVHLGRAVRVPESQIAKIISDGFVPAR
jgi:excisionase family DNA binding protein